MRQTNGQLLQAAKDACIDDTTTTFTGLSSAETFLKRENNNTVAYLFSLLKEYKLIPPAYTEATVAHVASYKFRPGFSKLESITTTNGTLVPTLKIVDSQAEWDRITQVAQSGAPTHVFPQRDTYILYPTPAAVYTLTITGIFTPVNMTADDYNTGTAAVTTGDETVTLTDGVITTADVGKWFAVVDATGVPSQNFYRILSRTSATVFELDRKVIEATATGLSFVIGQSPEVPDELHEFIPYRSASIYYMLRRRDATNAMKLLNFFYTGDFDNPNRKGNIKGGVLAVLRDLRENGRSNSNIVETAGGSESNYFRDGIWGLTLEPAP